MEFTRGYIEISDVQHQPGLYTVFTVYGYLSVCGFLCPAGAEELMIVAHGGDGCAIRTAIVT
jgi:hypothetical protein